MKGQRQTESTFLDWQPNRKATGELPITKPRSARLLCEECTHLQWRTREVSADEYILAGGRPGYEYQCTHLDDGEVHITTLTPSTCPFQHRTETRGALDYKALDNWVAEGKERRRKEREADNG